MTAPTEVLSNLAIAVVVGSPGVVITAPGVPIGSEEVQVTQTIDGAQHTISVQWDASTRSIERVQHDIVYDSQVQLHESCSSAGSGTGPLCPADAIGVDPESGTVWVKALHLGVLSYDFPGYTIHSTLNGSIAWRLR